MKISYRTHPLLKALAEYSLPIDQFMYDKISGCRIQFITKPFNDAINLALPKMTSDLYNELKNLSGVITNESVCYLYYVGDVNNFILYVFESKLLTRIATLQMRNGKSSGEVSDKFINDLQRSGYKHSAGSLLCSDLFKTLCFIKFANIESKKLEPNQKVKYETGKIINETSLPITILDSTWFTTLVKSDAFKVRGHFRLQPYGEGLKDRKLIWISDFEKTGYTAPARKLTVEL